MRCASALVTIGMLSEWRCSRQQLKCVKVRAVAVAVHYQLGELGTNCEYGDHRPSNYVVHIHEHIALFRHRRCDKLGYVIFL